jgi:hypothetical protein
MPSEVEDGIDHPANQMLWDKVTGKNFKKKYLPPEALELLEIKQIAESYRKCRTTHLNKISMLGDKALDDIMIGGGSLDMFSLAVTLYRLLTGTIPFARAIEKDPGYLHLI